jgi:hypothetical protein
MHRAYNSFDENEEALIQQGELADLRLAFPVSEETAARKSQK